MIERLLKEHLQGHSDELRPYLAVYNGKPAIFSLDVPDDNDSGWEGDQRYGRVAFTVAMEQSRERNIRGTLTVDVLCKKGQQNPEEIEPVLRPLIDGWFFNMDTGVISALWKESGYSIDAEKGLWKVTLIYELYMYPLQKTTEPDPVARINEWTKKELSEILKQDLYVIGWDTLPDTFKPTADHPAIYWRLSKNKKCNWIPDTNACSWQTAILRGHILTPDSEDTAIFIARVIDNALSVKRRLFFKDKSPLLVDRNIRIERNVRLLRTGQITVDASYGVLNLQNEAEDIKKIKFEER